MHCENLFNLIVLHGLPLVYCIAVLAALVSYQSVLVLRGGSSLPEEAHELGNILLEWLHRRLLFDYAFHQALRLLVIFLVFVHAQVGPLRLDMRVIQLGLSVELSRVLPDCSG